MVAYDYEANTSVAIPERWREIITAYQVVAPTVGQLKSGCASKHLCPVSIIRLQHEWTPPPYFLHWALITEHGA